MNAYEDWIRRNETEVMEKKEELIEALKDERYSGALLLEVIDGCEMFPLSQAFTKLLEQDPSKDTFIESELRSMLDISLRDHAAHLIRIETARRTTKVFQMISSYEASK